VKELIAIAFLLRDITGGFEQAEALVAELLQRGRRALDTEGIYGDRKLLLDRKLAEAGVLDGTGHPVRPRLAELIVLLDLLAAVPEATVVPAPDIPLLFTLPARAGDLVGLADRIDRRINDLIALSETELVFGGPFWNDAGLQMLVPVLEPALRRGVKARFYAHPQGEERDEPLRSFLKECAKAGNVSLAWWRSGAPSLMHAKFVIADAKAGYLGTANLTSLGMEEHLEIGVPLGRHQSESLVAVLDSLSTSGLFALDAS
jgi:hypothetical protein